MATNVVFKDAEFLSLPAPTGTKAGASLRIGILNAVTVTAEGSVTETITVGAGASIVQPSGALSGNLPGFASVALHGSAILSVVGALTVGQAVYIKTSDNTLTATSTGNFVFGSALRAKGSGTGDVLVKILQPGQTVASA